MVILGINGWPERSHDASACLMVDGKLVAYVEEERFVRLKHAFDRLPYQAIAYCLEVSNLRPDDLDVIACGWNMPALYFLHGRNFDYGLKDLNDLILPEKYFGKRSKKIPVEFVDHHLAHAASVYAGRENDEPLPIVVIDGAGEDKATSIFLGHQGKLKLLESFPLESSLGLFYETSCQYLGLSHWDSGKLMGLASYGTPQETEFFGREGSPWLPPFHFTKLSNKSLDWEEELNRQWLEQFRDVWGEPSGQSCRYDRLKGYLVRQPDLGRRQQDIAASIQQELERLYLWYVRRALSIFSSPSLGLAGGVSLNCSANGLLKDSGLISKIYVHPAAHDAGTALGAALTMLDTIPANFFNTPYLGPEFSSDEIMTVLKDSGTDFFQPSDLNQMLASDLAQGKSVGYFQGRLEVGPRALGGRSILADPRQKENHSRINSLKSRENWRPLAPAIAGPEGSDYFGLTEPSPYMLIRYFSQPDKISAIPAVIHVDGSVRPQTVNADWHPEFYDLLLKFKAITGVPVLLNTSFNNEREPIVCTPTDALRTFFSSGLDELAIGPFLIKKSQNHKIKE